MKLSNLPWRNQYKRLRVDMRARQSEWKPEVNWEPIYIDERLRATGIDIFSLKEIEFANDGTFEFAGRKVIVYIRDQNVTYRDGYRFHIADCEKIQEMRMKDRFQRKYVVATRLDGKFVVNLLSEGKLIKKDDERNLSVCKYCLSRLNYSDYEKVPFASRDRIWKNFDLGAFFERYRSHIMRNPTHTDRSAPLNNYTQNWDRVSQRCREQAGWKCSKCREYLGEDSKKRFLHVHHIDGLKYNNREQNLKVLCIVCHAEIDDQLKYSPDYAEYQQIMQLIESA